MSVLKELINANNSLSQGKPTKVSARASVRAGFIMKKLGGRLVLNGNPIYKETLKVEVSSSDPSLPSRPAEITIKYIPASLFNTPSSLLSNGFITDGDFRCAKVSCVFKDKAPQVLIDKAEESPARRGGSWGTLSGLVESYYGEAFLREAAKRIQEVVALRKPRSPSTIFEQDTYLSGSVDSYSPVTLGGILYGSGIF